jgi:hypothetical protein
LPAGLVISDTEAEGYPVDLVYIQPGLVSEPIDGFMGGDKTELDKTLNAN